MLQAKNAEPAATCRAAREITQINLVQTRGHHLALSQRGIREAKHRWNAERRPKGLQTLHENRVRGFGT
jgi:hypothetical protein